ncbi:putative toxin-antitoxin system toxin component, PIN family [Limnohabitans sp.]|uniref:putative toxin-antitoxin system toxin component, PIN family n=1 Tax=Limnohabitans sp. TaxID=1907725 RepID=UPI0033428826
MSAAFRVVLDTNVVLSALVFRGAAAGQLRQSWQRGLILPLVSTATAQELVRVLAYPKFRLSPAEQNELLADYLPYTETVRIAQPPPKVPHCRDALDLPFMHLAVAGKAHALVSGDRDLLAIAAEFERFCSCPIVGLEVFCTMPPLTVRG